MKKTFLLTISCMVITLLSSGINYADGWRKVTSYSMEPVYAIHFTSETVGYCVGGNTGPVVALVYKTTDGGATWKEVYRDETAKQLNKVYFVNSNLGFAAGAGAKLIKTTDAGQSWTPITISGTANDIVGLYFSDEQNGWVLTNAGVLKTADGGKNWTSVLSLTGATMYDMSFWGANHGVVTGKSVADVYYTTDGTTWKKATPAVLTAGSYTRSDLRGVFAFDDNSIYAAGWGSLATGQPTVIVKSTDGGATWTQLVGSEKYWDYIYDVTFKDKNNGVAIGGSSRASLAIRTTDGGTTWSQLNIPCGGAVRGIFSIANTIWTCTEDGNIVRSKDFGTTWELMPGIPKTSIYNVKSPANNIIYASGDDGAFLKSVDGGKTWNTKFVRINNISPNIKDMFFLNDKVGYISHQSRRVCKTTDGGETWKEILPDTSATGFYSYGIHFVNESKGFVVGCLSSKVDFIYRTKDGGATWDSVSYILKTNLKSVAFGSDNNGAVVGDALKAAYTNDGGNTWKVSTFNNVPSTKATANLTKVTFSDPLNAVAVGNAIVLRTTDGGANWNFVDITGITENLSGVAFKDALNGWTAGSRNASPKKTSVLKTTDGGSTWTDVADTTVLNYSTTLVSMTIDKNNMVWAGALYGTIFTNSPATGVIENKAVLNSFELSQNYPNPFNPSTTIEYSIKQTGNVTLNVYDVLGKCVKSLINENQKAGTYKVNLNATDLASGLYLYSLNVDGQVITKKMSLIK
ncbi:MAG: YCF48-related protein [Bacillota bacterium]